MDPLHIITTSIIHSNMIDEKYEKFYFSLLYTIILVLLIFPLYLLNHYKLVEISGLVLKCSHPTVNLQLIYFYVEYLGITNHFIWHLIIKKGAYLFHFQFIHWRVFSKEKTWTKKLKKYLNLKQFKIPTLNVKIWAVKLFLAMHEFKIPCAIFAQLAHFPAWFLKFLAQLY